MNELCTGQTGLLGSLSFFNCALVTHNTVREHAIVCTVCEYIHASTNSFHIATDIR